MKKSIALWQFFGFMFTAVCGTLLHFLYELSGKNPIVGLISSINESTWEHMKLLFVPLVLFALFERRFFNNRRDFWCVKALGIIGGVVLIPVLFYTLNGAFGKTPDGVNIAIYFVAAALTFISETVLFNKNAVKCRHKAAAIPAIAVTAALFVIFTYRAPDLPLFLPPEV